MEGSIRLKIPFNEFKSLMDVKISEAANLHKLNVVSEQDYIALESAKGEWESTTIKILENSFESAENEYINDFKYSRSQYFLIPGSKLNVKQKSDNEKETIRIKQRALWDAVRLISVSDLIINTPTADFSKRAVYTIEQKLNLLLEKLYELYDDLYYPVKTILIGNGIKLKRYDEDRELTEILENAGYIETMGTEDGVSARLTATGAMHVEEKRKEYTEKYDDINQSKEEMDSRVDEILQKLTTLGFGQEIIFDEIQELKELYSKLSKKNWGQIVKGKLVDLALGKLVDNDTLQFIYEKLTHHPLRLP